MAITNEKYERILKFLDADMSVSEMNSFEQALNNDPEMRQQLNFEQALRDSFAFYKKQHDFSARSEQTIKVRPVKVMAKRWIVAAAVVTVIIAIPLLWMRNDRSEQIVKTLVVDSAKKSVPILTDIATKKDSALQIKLHILFKQYFQKDTIPDVHPVFLSEALLDYETGNYKTIQQLDLNQLPQMRGSDTEGSDILIALGHYYKGLAWLSSGNTKQAYTELEWVTKNEAAKSLQPKAEWYLLMLYLKENNLHESKKQCLKIIEFNKERELVKKAKRILSSLET